MTAKFLLLLDRFIPRYRGEPTSIGSIPHAAGDACGGACRFHRKGKCFDGALCRFCHLPDDHPGSVRKASKKARKARKIRTDVPQMFDARWATRARRLEAGARRDRP